MKQKQKKMQKRTEFKQAEFHGCPICLLEVYSDDESCCFTQCLHYYHYDCLSQWLKNNIACCICRNKIQNYCSQKDGQIFIGEKKCSKQKSEPLPFSSSNEINQDNQSQSLSILGELRYYGDSLQYHRRNMGYYLFQPSSPAIEEQNSVPDRRLESKKTKKIKKSCEKKQNNSQIQRKSTRLQDRQKKVRK